MKNITRNLSISLALIGGAALAPQAFAEESYALSFQPEQVVSVTDMQDLQAEIREVAEDYCPKYRDVRSFRLVNSCVSEVTADLVSKVAQPAFSAFVESQTRRAAPALIAAND